MTDTYSLNPHPTFLLQIFKGFLVALNFCKPAGVSVTATNLFMFTLQVSFDGNFDSLVCLTRSGVEGSCSCKSLYRFKAFLISKVLEDLKDINETTFIP